MNNDWLDIGVLEDYLDGKLDAKTMNKVEREALEDPFVAEALAGLSASPKRSLASISLLQKQLKERISEQQVAKKTKVITWQRLSIAATAAVLFIAVSVIFWMKEVAQQNQLAKQGKAIDVSIKPENTASGVSAAPNADVVPPALADAVKGTIAQNKKPKTNATEKTPATVASLSIADAERKALIVEGAIQRSAKSNSYASNAKKKVARVNEEAGLSETLPSRVAGVEVSRSPYSSPMAKSIQSATMIRPMLSGKVISDLDGKPLSGAEIRVLPATTAVNALTDQNGEFKIPTDSISENYNISVSHPGFASNVKVARINEPVDIILKKQLMIGSAFYPTGGWEQFNKYLQENNQLTRTQQLGATLDISFLIGKDGKPYDFKFLRSMGEKYEREAIRLISEGPKWEQPLNPEGRVRISIKF
ncbi:carboxypeptidase-like regulatory domain-containing protein [Pedobacter gandavensis]|uniref:carboxypeptidase-like regulatory domain-containing protein n=1 Tax=Pedobacter gandavensis TaxID=2679963 RepID=UPI002930B82A|nr:carboxypeptidase-like regulatory domain-containing protein [Pedobacter gandavensis]